MNPPAPGVLVVGVGATLRGDDGVGPLAVAGLDDGSVAVAVCAGGASLLDLWRGARAVVIADAVRTGAPPGTLHRFDATARPLPLGVTAGGTHALGVGDAIELARVLDHLPGRVIVHGVEPARFALGTGLTGPVAAAIPRLVRALRDEVAALAAGR